MERVERGGTRRPRRRRGRQLLRPTAGGRGWLLALGGHPRLGRRRRNRDSAAVRGSGREGTGLGRGEDRLRRRIAAHRDGPAGARLLRRARTAGGGGGRAGGGGGGAGAPGGAPR